MNNSENFINWLEGFLDACKNKPNYSQIREIRKKISINKSTAPKFTMITDSPVGHSLSQNNDQLNEEQKALLEKSRGATTMEELG